MLKKSLFALCVAVSLALSAADPVVNIVPLGPIFLPAPNLLKNADFSQGTKYWDVFPKGTTAIVVDQENTPVKGMASLKITGQDKVSNGSRERVYFKPALKAGEPVYIRIASRNEEPDLERTGRGGLAIHAFYTDKKSSYLRAPTLPREDHDWTYVEGIFTAPKDMVDFSFYLTYYNQEGTQWFADPLVQAGTTKLQLDVTGAPLAKVVLRHSVTGTILSESAKGNEFHREVTVPAFGSYCLEATGADGKVVTRLYPENVDANVAASDAVIPLTPIKRLILKHLSKPEVIPFEAAVPAGKKAYLQFDARLMRDNLAGYTGGLRIAVNGTTLGAKQLVSPKPVFTTSKGRKANFVQNSGYVLFYAQACFGISVENSYCPVDVPGRNPFRFKIDVTDLLKAGRNEISLVNTLGANNKVDACVEYLRIVIE